MHPRRNMATTAMGQNTGISRLGISMKESKEAPTIKRTAGMTGHTYVG
jgi:hypothetical protein